MQRSLGKNALLPTRGVLFGLLFPVLPLAAVLSGAAGAAGCSSSDAAPASGAAVEAPAPAPVAAPFVEEVAVDEVAVYQAVKTTLVKEGELVPALKINAPVIAGRPAFVRVFAKAIARTRPTVEAELRVKRAGKEDLVLRDHPKRLGTDVDDSLLESTFNFELAAEDMTADAAFSVRVAKTLDTTEAVSFPVDGSLAPFGAKTASKTLKVKFVPISYEADAEVAPIVPDLADLSSLKDTLYKMFPVASVDVSVRAPLKWSSVIEPDGDGWDGLLGGLMQLRRTDAVERDVYYVGVLTPKDTIEQFCNKGSCVLGIAPQADERSVSMRVALVLGYKSRSAGGTLAQELAHAMGRLHAPCGGPQAIDGWYPYGNGGIGVWGYDILTKDLIDPSNRYRDFMSYCGPVWTSDYTFGGLYERMETITKQQEALAAANGGAPTGSGAPGSASEIRPSFRVAADGSVHEGPDLEVILGGPGPAASDTADVSYESDSGRVLATGKGRVQRIAGGTGGSFVIAPKAPAGAVRARLAGIGVTNLRRLGPAR